MSVPAAARAVAESTLTDTATVTARARDTAPGGVLAAGAVTTIYVGPCSLGPPASSNETTSGADVKTIDTRIMRLPSTTDNDDITQGNPNLVAVGHYVTVGGQEFVVDRVQTKTREVLRRVRLVAAVDAESVPR